LQHGCTTTALVIAGIIPIDLLVAEEKSVADAIRAVANRKDARKMARDTSVTEWQCRWVISESGRWTYRLTNIGYSGSMVQ